MAFITLVSQCRVFGSFNLEHSTFAFDRASAQLGVNPDRLILDLRLRTRDYIAELRSTENDKLRRNFEVRFNEDNGIPQESKQGETHLTESK